MWQNAKCVPYLKGGASLKSSRFLPNGNVGPVWPCIPLFQEKPGIWIYIRTLPICWCWLEKKLINTVWGQRNSIFYQICLEGCKFVISGKRNWKKLITHIYDVFFLLVSCCIYSEKSKNLNLISFLKWQHAMMEQSEAAGAKVLLILVTDTYWKPTSTQQGIYKLVITWRVEHYLCFQSLQTSVERVVSKYYNTIC